MKMTVDHCFLMLRALLRKQPAILAVIHFVNVHKESSPAQVRVLTSYKVLSQCQQKGCVNRFYKQNIL